MGNRTTGFLLITVLLLGSMLGAPVVPAQPVLGGEIYTLDNEHSLLDFTVRQVGFGRVRGTFKNYQAAIYYDEEDLTRSSVTVVIEVKTIDTGSDFRDRHLRSPDFFDAEKFPSLKFQSQRVERTPDGYAVVGPLTIRDVTREIRIPFQVVSQRATDQFHNQRIVFEGRLSLNRRDFGVVGPDFWNKLIADTIEIDLSVAGSIFNYLNPFNRWRDKSIGKLLLDSIEKDGVVAARQQVVDLWQGHRQEYLFELEELYTAAMQLTQRGRHQEAIQVFDLTVNLFKDSADPKDLTAVFASRAETQARLGERERAIESVEKALALSPDNARARELLRHLKK